MDEQVEAVLMGLHEVLGQNLVGAYLHGSSVLGGLKPRSDLDIIGVSGRRATLGEKRELVELLMKGSGRVGSIGAPHPIEFDLVVESEIRPWRHPALVDFHYDELIREELEAGKIDLSTGIEERGFAPLVRMARSAKASLYGPPPTTMFDPVPTHDYHDAILKDIEEIDRWIVIDTRNVILTLARVWAGLRTDDIHSKDSCVFWALPRLSRAHRGVLERALAIYRCEAEEYWDDVRPQVQAFAEFVVAEIKATPGYANWLRGRYHQSSEASI
jgi:predicted nucleotidyltransferase